MFNVQVQDNEETINCNKTLDNQCGTAVDAEHKMFNPGMNYEWFTTVWDKVKLFSACQLMLLVIQNTIFTSSAVAACMYEALQHMKLLLTMMSTVKLHLWSNPEENVFKVQHKVSVSLKPSMFPVHKRVHDGISTFERNISYSSSAISLQHCWLYYHNV